MRSPKPPFRTLSLLLGAGASRDLGFPDGRQLLDQVCAEFDAGVANRPGIFADAGVDREVLQVGASKISRLAETNASIDAVLEEVCRGEGSNAELGKQIVAASKLAVAKIILAHESEAKNRNMDDFWLVRFLNSYAKNFAGPYPGQLQILGDLSIQTYNYDRVVTHILHDWLPRRFPRHARSMEGIIREDFPIVRHLHGSLGRLRDVNVEKVVPFGGNPSNRLGSIKTAAANLKFWFELPPDPHCHQRTNRITELRDDVLILGFGYHNGILGRMASVHTQDRMVMRVFGSAYRLPDERREKVVEALAKRLDLGAKHVTLFDREATCAGAVAQYLEMRERGA